MEGRPMTGNYWSEKGRESCDWKQESENGRAAYDWKLQEWKGKGVL